MSSIIENLIDIFLLALGMEIVKYTLANIFYLYIPGVPKKTCGV
jgi:hypothetical protein